MTISWMLQILQSCYKSKCLTSLSFGSIIAGSEIPTWFDNELVSMHNSIIIDASPFLHDDNWVGVVCCAIFGKGISDHAGLFYFRSYKFCTFSIRDMIRLCKERMHRYQNVVNFEVKKFGYRWINKRDLINEEEWINE